MSRDADSEAPVVSESRKLDPKLTATFLQCLMAQKSLSARNALKIVTSIDRADDPARPSANLERLDLYVDELMTYVLGRLSMKIVKYRDQKSRDIEYHLVNSLGSDNVSKFGTALTPAELEYFRSMVDHMFSSTTIFDKFFIAETRLMDCNRITVVDADGTERTTVLLDRQAIDKLVVKLENEGWLRAGDVSGVVVYTLGNRALCELEHYLEDKFGENGDQTLRHCMICARIFTVGWQCGTSGCPGRLHVPCGDTLSSRLAHGRLDCLKCKADINENHEEVGI